MERITTNVNKAVKDILKDLKSSLKLSNESEVIAYLYAIYENHYPKITLPEQEKALQRMNDLHNQQTM
jgi:flagellin-specific chaperone FliS